MALVDNNVRIIGFGDPALDEEVVIFTCPSGWTLSGPSSSTCTRNGEWEPDPREVNCIGVMIATTGTPTILRTSRALVATYVSCSLRILPK